MELFVFRHADWERGHNCSQVDIDSIPLSRRQFVPESEGIILLCALYYLLYVPCLVSIWRRMANNPCYQLLFCIGLLDLGVLWGLGFYVGWMSLAGRVFCSAPTLNYWVGIAVTSGAVTECMVDLVLAVNRTLNMIWPHCEQLLFSGNKIRYWLVLCSAYGLYRLVFTIPLLYSSVNFGGWFFNPYAGYLPTPADDSVPLIHEIHNDVLTYVLPAIYVVFTVGFVASLKCNQGSHASAIGMRQQLMIFLQVFIISMCNASAGFFYLYCQVAPTVTQTAMTVGQFSWFHMHGAPPLVYLLLNNTIRQDCRRMATNLFRKRGQQKAPTQAPQNNKQTNNIRTIRVHPVANNLNSTSQVQAAQASPVSTLPQHG